MQLSTSQRNKIITDHYDYINLTAKKYLNQFRIKNPDDRDDITQDIFVKIIEGLNTFDPSKSEIKTWIDRCIYHHLLDYKKSSKNEAELHDDYTTYLDDDTICNKIMLSDLCNKLSFIDRQIVELKQQGYKSKEIAEKLQITDDSVRQKFARIIKKYKSSVT